MGDAEVAEAKHRAKRTIVCTPSEAHQYFIRTDTDCLVLGNLLLGKSKQDAMVSDEPWNDVIALP